jgi:hypothetical protein
VKDKSTAQYVPVSTQNLIVRGVECLKQSNLLVLEKDLLQQIWTRIMMKEKEML